MSAIGFKYSQSKKSRNPIGGGIASPVIGEPRRCGCLLLRRLQSART